MTKAILLFVYILFSYNTFSQSFEIYRGFGSFVDVQGTTITEVAPLDYNPGVPADFEIGVELYVKNSPTPKDVRVKSIELSGNNDWKNYFCWVNCWSPKVFGVQPVFDQSGVKNDSFLGMQCRTYVQSNTGLLLGPVKMRYVFYDNNNPQDSAYVDIIYTRDSLISTASIVEELGHSAISVFPNPANDKISISSDEDLNVQFFDLSGQLKYEQIYQGGFIRINHLMTGVYFIRMERKDGNFEVRKWIKN